MFAFEHILFPVDLSDLSDLMAPRVAEIADRFDAQIHVLLVEDDIAGPETTVGPHPFLASHSERKMQDLGRALRRFIEFHYPDRKVASQVLIGDPARRIVSYAIATGMDLIVMGTHGRKGIRRILAGSVTEQVMESSPIPVLTVNLNKRFRSFLLPTNRMNPFEYDPGAKTSEVRDLLHKQSDTFGDPIWYPF